MKRSTDRILTTHTGSLPRPWDLVTLLEQRENGELIDREDFDAQVRTAVQKAVQQQVEADVDVVSDGEQGKIGYSTYVKDRLFGFDGENIVPSRSDWLAFPDAATRRAGSVGIRRPSCNGPIGWKDREQIHTDIKNFEAALFYVQPEEYFMTAASPGVISIFLRNEYYPSREEYLSALADVMKEEYDAICQAGYLLQVDCPDLAMGRHLHFPELSVGEFLKIAEANVEVLNHALRDIPADQVRLHLCWGNYEGPHHRDIPLKNIIQIVLKARVGAISFEGANPRHEHEWKVFQDINLPDGMLIIPGVVDSTTNFIEHPELIAQRIVRYAELVGRENVIAGSDCGFGTFVRANPTIEPEIAWEKLAVMAEGATLATEELWPKANSRK